MKASVTPPASVLVELHRHRRPLPSRRCRQTTTTTARASGGASTMVSLSEHAKREEGTAETLTGDVSVECGDHGGRRVSLVRPGSRRRRARFATSADIASKARRISSLRRRWRPPSSPSSRRLRPRRFRRCASRRQRCSGSTASSPCSAKAAWASSTRRATWRSAATSRSSAAPEPRGRPG